MALSDADVDSFLGEEKTKPTAPAPMEMRAPAAKPKTSGTESVARGAKDSALFGFGDELAGVGSWIGDKLASAVHRKEISPSAAPYTEGRDEEREKDKHARESHSYLYTAGQIGAALATAPVTGIGGGVAKNIARGAAQGAAHGAGSSEAELKDGEIARFAKDVGTGAAVGGVVAAGGEAAAAGVRKVASTVKDSIRRRLLNEVAEGTASTTATQRKHLDKAGDQIVKEYTVGRDAPAVRKAIRSGDASKGRETIAPIVDRLAKRNAAAYAEFERAGKSVINLGEYGSRLEAAAVAADKAGQTRLASGIRAVKDRAEEMAKRSAAAAGHPPSKAGQWTLPAFLELTQARGLTTEAQGIAAGVLGSLSEPLNAKVAKRVAAAVTEAMDDTLGEAAKGSKQLVSAANRIRANNQRLHALLSIDDALEKRAFKENTGRSAAVRLAEKVAGPAAIGATGGAFSSENKLEGALGGALGGAAIRYGIPAAVRAADRAVTAEAVRATSGGARLSLGKAQRVARTGGSIAAGKLASDAVTDDELTRLQNEQRERLRREQGR